MIRSPQHARPFDSSVGGHRQFEHNDGLQGMRRAALKDPLPIDSLNVLRQYAAPFDL